MWVARLVEVTDGLAGRLKGVLRRLLDLVAPSRPLIFQEVLERLSHGLLLGAGLVETGALSLFGELLLAVGELVEAMAVVEELLKVIQPLDDRAEMGVGLAQRGEAIRFAFGLEGPLESEAGGRCLVVRHLPSRPCQGHEVRLDVEPFSKAQ